MSLEEASYTSAEEVRLSGGGEVSWRLLATLEVATLLLVVLALCLHALRTRAARARTLNARTVLITKGETELGQKLAREFSKKGCIVTLLVSKYDELPEIIPVPNAAVKNRIISDNLKETSGPASVLPPSEEAPKGNLPKLIDDELKFAEVAPECVAVSNSAAVQRMPTRIIHCNTRSRDEVRLAAEKIADLDILVVCGAQSDGDRLDSLAKNVSEDIYSNLHLLQELGRRLKKSGSAVWVCGEPKGPYSGAVRALHRLASAVLHQMAHSRGGRAVWCEGRAETTERLAARVVRTVARDGVLPTSADVFREVKYRLRTGLREIISRFCKLWT